MEVHVIIVSRSEPETGDSATAVLGHTAEQAVIKARLMFESTPWCDIDPTDPIDVNAEKRLNLMNLRLCKTVQELDFWFNAVTDGAYTAHGLIATL